MDKRTKKLNELDTEMAGIIDIVEMLSILCNDENFDECANKLYILTSLLKQKCFKLDFLHCELKYIYMSCLDNAEDYTYIGTI